MDKIVTVIAPVNIAVIKYWGKRDENLILPLNDSVSCTLDMEHMCTKTTIMASPSFSDNTFWLNGKEENFNSTRFNNCLKAIRKRVDSSNDDLLGYKLHICSENNFPTAAGLASSAAGYAGLVFSLAALYNIKGDISGIARQGSGSACRSIYGGFVCWKKGERADGEDSLAVQIAPSSHWPQLHLLILVVSDTKKTYSSSSGMKTSVQTSKLLKYRAENVVPQRTRDIIDAIDKHNFEKFAKLTMEDSNQFHAVCLDTYPPCFYMNDVSRAIIELIHKYNDYKKSIKVAYTFDAGSNACLYLLEEDITEVSSLINTVFPPSSQTKQYFQGIPTNTEITPLLNDFQIRHPPGLLKYIIHTKVGDGPKVLLDSTQHLLTTEGLPKH